MWESIHYEQLSSSLSLPVPSLSFLPSLSALWLIFPPSPSSPSHSLLLSLPILLTPSLLCLPLSYSNLYLSVSPLHHYLSSLLCLVLSSSLVTTIRSFVLIQTLFFPLLLWCYTISDTSSLFSFISTLSTERDTDPAICYLKHAAK